MDTNKKRIEKLQKELALIKEDVVKVQRILINFIAQVAEDDEADEEFLFVPEPESRGIIDGCEIIEFTPSKTDE